jgi:hypothetical protein
MLAPFTHIAGLLIATAMSITGFAWLYGVEQLWLVFFAVLTHGAVFSAIATAILLITFGKLERAFKALK